MLTEPLAVTKVVIDALDAVGVPYVLGGSLASALHGTARSTMDADLVVVMETAHVSPFVALVQTQFYVDEGAALRAVERRQSFNLLHLETMFKVDLFVAKDRPFDTAQIANRQAIAFGDDRSQTMYVLSPEDTVLAKLDWYRLGNEQSERQWRDVLGIVRMQAGRLDWAYLRVGAAGLDITDLLQRLWAETDAHSNNHKRE